VASPWWATVPAAIMPRTVEVNLANSRCPTWLDLARSCGGTWSDRPG
jgi:hypothetical protein